MTQIKKATAATLIDNVVNEEDEARAQNRIRLFWNSFLSLELVSKLKLKNSYFMPHVIV